MRAVVAAMLVLGACVAADEPVLTAGPTLTSCVDVLERQFDQQACAFDGVCTWSDAQPNGMACCTYFAVCAEGRLLVEPMCAGGDPGMCAACPAGTEPVMNGGCATCTCAPPSQCDGTDPNACDPGESCYRGQVCADDCMSGQLDCCANVCALPGCAEPAPLGCRMDCPMELGCAQCMATACTCAAGVWSCTPVCSDVVGPCFLP